MVVPQTTDPVTRSLPTAAPTGPTSARGRPTSTTGPTRDSTRTCPLLARQAPGSSGPDLPPTERVVMESLPPNHSAKIQQIFQNVVELVFEKVS